MKHNWEYKRLGDVCDIYQPQTISTKELIENGQFDVFGANGIIGKYNKYNHENPEVLLTCRGATCGSINLSNPKSWINGNAMVIHDKSNLLSQAYLKLCMSSLDYSNIITGAAQPQITRTKLSPILIPVPPMAVQERIVAELDRINEVIEKSRELLRTLDSLAQSIFYDTFGDPITNPKGWETTLFGNLIRLKSGDALSAKNFCNGQYPVYGGNGIAGYHNRYNISGQNIIIGRVGALCGNVRLINANIFVTDNAFVVNLQQNINLRFLVRLLTLLELRKYANAAAQPVISNSSLKTITIPIPPLSLQNEFATKIEAIEEQKKRIDSSIVDLRILLESRIDYWFNDI